jgi:transcriptional regulator with XRE-family HTH domain
MEDDGTGETLDELVDAFGSGAVVARRIREERERMHLSQSALSRILRDGVGLKAIAQSSISKIEAGERDVTVDELLTFSRAFRVPISALLLPDEQRHEIDGQRLFMAAESRLGHIRQEWNEYASEIRKVQRRAQASPSLRKILIEYLDDATEALRHEIASVRRVKASEVSDALIDANATPAIVAARDALGEASMLEHPWAERSITDA